MISSHGRDVFLVQKPGNIIEWVEQDDFADHYEEWLVIRRATIDAKIALQQAIPSLGVAKG